MLERRHRFTEERIETVFHWISGQCGNIGSGGGKCGCVLCPEYQPLAYRATNRDGYRE